MSLLEALATVVEQDGSGDVGVGIQRHGAFLGADLYRAGGCEQLKPVLGAGGAARCTIAPSFLLRLPPEGPKRLKTRMMDESDLSWSTLRSPDLVGIILGKPTMALRLTQPAAVAHNARYAQKAAGDLHTLRQLVCHWHHLSLVLTTAWPQGESLQVAGPRNVADRRVYARGSFSEASLPIPSELNST